ncbi:DUF4407 domain-containing protein [Allosalinactinospora lopnorensis]|uniref:DUF4407 domain-containing protein n=1 Tax=Allosalinactinospora lopnorensis TaxID=1352348 RepID=UPI00069728D6|nr:DUF4407 domain-containing protein [Allosalinactinospora lopnorensis]
MATSTGAAPQTDGDQVPVDPHRPAPPVIGLGRWPRRLIGVVEELLDWVPEERSRYTWQGLIVIGAGCAAMISVLVAVTSITGVNPLWLLPFAVFWGAMIATIDGWLISTTHGVATGFRWLLFIPRIVLTVLLSFVIAEPLVLYVFHPAIEQETQRHRADEIDAYESRLTECNPVDGGESGSDCADFLIKVEGAAPDAARDELARAVQERDDLLEEKKELDDQWQEMNEDARKECGGADGEDFTGVVGEGPNCVRLRGEADDFRADNDLGGQQERIDELNARIDELEKSTGGTFEAYEKQLSEEIATKVREREDAHGRVGLLEEMDALHRLQQDSFYVWAGVWLLRLCLMTVDALPVLTKLMSRSSTYDMLYSRQLVTNEDLFTMESDVRKRRDTAAKRVELEAVEFDVQEQIRRLNVADRAGQASSDAELNAQIDALADRLRDTAPAAQGRHSKLAD